VAKAIDKVFVTPEMRAVTTESFVAPEMRIMTTERFPGTLRAAQLKRKIDCAIFLMTCCAHHLELFREPGAGTGVSGDWASEGCHCPLRALRRESTSSLLPLTLLTRAILDPESSKDRCLLLSLSKSVLFGLCPSLADLMPIHRVLAGWGHPATAKFPPSPSVLSS
jgi:hypothetical protein